MGQAQSVSCRHATEHPSPDAVFPSSHSSSLSKVPLPQPGGMPQPPFGSWRQAGRVSALPGTSSEMDKLLSNLMNSAASSLRTGAASGSVLPVMLPPLQPTLAAQRTLAQAKLARTARATSPRRCMVMVLYPISEG